jgi:hypothetical protein
MILFLDFDGVLHPAVNGEPDFCRLPLLWEILRACPHVDIVLSTSWRELYCQDDLVQLVTRGGGEDLAHRFIGSTPSFLREKNVTYLWHRNTEILTWLEGNGCSHRAWLAVDDTARWFPKNSPRCYLTNPKTGLTEADVTAIIQRIKPVSVFGSEWGQQVLRNVQRMTVDEEYRKSIAKDLS